ncbi:MAG: hypothetical protein ACRDQW_08780 [Haloechinothrix sp.]
MVDLPEDLDEKTVEVRAAQRGIAINGMRHYRTTGGGSPALVIGYTRTSEQQIEQAVGLLAISVCDSLR